MDGVGSVNSIQSFELQKLCPLRPHDQRKGQHKHTSKNEGDRKAPLGSGWFFIIPHLLRLLHFPAVRESFLSSLTLNVPQVIRGMSELAAASFGEPGCVPQWEQSGDSQLKKAAHKLSSSWKRRIGSLHHSFALQRTDAVHGCFVRERVPSFIWRVPKCSFSVSDPLKPQGSHLSLLSWQHC